jgi:hypothetical protein
MRRDEDPRGENGEQDCDRRRQGGRIGRLEARRRQGGRIGQLEARRGQEGRKNLDHGEDLIKKNN